jgi:hypothetical protein
MATFKEWYKNLNKKIKNQFLKDIVELVMDLYVYIKCPKCKRKLPNETLFTSKGCKWCDIKYARKHLNKKKKVQFNYLRKEI